MSSLQRYAWAYAAGFIFIAFMGYIPAFLDENGYLFGLFSLELHDNLLHLVSGLWAAWAAWKSEAESLRYFRIFGVVYGLDGVLGLITGLGYLDLGIVLQPFPNLDLMTRVFANLPHILIGGVAVLIGYVWHREPHVAKAR